MRNNNPRWLVDDETHHPTPEQREALMVWYKANLEPLLRKSRDSACLICDGVRRGPDWQCACHMSSQARGMYALRLRLGALDEDNFGAVLLTGMELLGLDAEAAARLFDVSRRTVLRWLRGQTKPHPVVRRLVRQQFLRRARSMGDATARSFCLACDDGHLVKAGAGAWKCDVCGAEELAWVDE